MNHDCWLQSDRCHFTSRWSLAQLRTSKRWLLRGRDRPLCSDLPTSHKWNWGTNIGSECIGLFLR